ncbi:MAG: hypothetical protein Q4B82_08700 [Alysiella sp.]|uniref:hypothetical protein n=1 Tax=Alysiella sp. TaxID=1872483 RepID=UPI0026DB33F8|nr:hypothetical protein [Alysiella sp.]MDO4434639.1 hypothetical protein [Alysiella sp.]
MSSVQVNCPQCKQKNELDKSLLEWTQGQVVCVHCGHQFQMVKRPKSNATQKQIVAEQKVPEPVFRQPVVEAVNESSAVQTPKEGQQQPKKAAILHYRIPKAPTKMPRFVAVEDSPLAFNLMDRDSMNAQLPQVAIKPAVSVVDPTQRSGEPQNNITIHTDSLVFTLVSDNGMNSVAHLPQTQVATTLPAFAATAVQQPVAIVNAHETNWTIATIAALAVLIIQLFSLILMLI